MHNKLFFWETTITLRKKRRFYKWTLYYFFISFGLVMCYESQTWGPMAVENMYVIYFMHIDLSKSLHLTIGSSLTLIQNELWVPKFCHAHSKVLFLMFRVSKKIHQDVSLLHTHYTCYTSLFWVKSGEKWFTCSVNHPTPDQHQQKTNTQIPSLSYNTYSNSSLTIHTQLFWHHPQIT
jgi:hypothetical protein